ncbi:MAG: PEP-CTERM sorting domain-containing protein, partial [Pirellulales bacterium]
GHKQIGAHFNRFGIITTHIDGSGQTVYFDDLSYAIGTVPEPSSATLTGSVLLIGALSFRRRMPTYQPLP